jgi:hypothetical protein
LWLEFVVVMSLVGCARAPACYRPATQTRGWKEVRLPAAAPHLAAPDGVEQYRTGEPALAWSGWSDVGPHRSLGAASYYLYLPEGAEVLEIDFGSRLGGAALEINSLGDDGWNSFRSRFRTHDSRLSLELDPRTRAVEVLVHNHLRAPPQPRWRSGRRELPEAPPRRLYYFDRGEGGLELCEAPARKLGFREGGSLEPATRTALSPTVLTRLLHKELDN